MVGLWKLLSGLEYKGLGRLHDLQSQHVGLCPGYDRFLTKKKYIFIQAIEQLGLINIKFDQAIF